ncbi:hypothetical protein B484DRAFT_402526 [Ochromonadaceae sp. CCMP2298]|nr:hypothetical protein B484DRAFT_402526 [Ochromonadaceae sp. CCMP2298]
MAKSVTRRMLDLIMNEFGKSTFSICLMPSATGFAHTDFDKGVAFTYRVPENLCRQHMTGTGKSGTGSGSGTGGPIFSAAAIMALFDEISTYACLAKDKTHRPGVSVHLSTEIVQSVKAGEEVTIYTRCDKVGKTLAYCSLEVLDSRGQLVASGKHIKHLPMGLHWDIINHPLLVPYTLYYYENFLANKGREAQQGGGQGEQGGKNDFHRATVPASFPSLEGVGQVFELLGLQVEGGGAFNMTVSKPTSNLLGNMHGGAVGCAVEQACVLAREQQGMGMGQEQGVGVGGGGSGRQGQYKLGCYVKGVEVRYISPMKGEVVITTGDDPHSPLMGEGGGGGGFWRTRSVGQVRGEGGQLCAEYVCTWALVE